MNCENCGKEMEEGFVLSAYWGVVLSRKNKIGSKKDADISARVCLGCGKVMLYTTETDKIAETYHSSPFTSERECEEKLNRLDALIKEAEECLRIQFPIEEDDFFQFQHYCVNRAWTSLKALKENASDIREELEKHKKRQASRIAK